MVAKMLASDGSFNVWLYSIQGGGVIPHLEGITSGSLNVSNGQGLAKKIKNYYLKVHRLSQLKKQLAIDVSISSLWPVDWINALTGHEKKVAVIQINILNNVQNEKMVKLRKLVTAVYSRFDKVVLGGGNLIEEMNGFFKIEKQKLLVIQNPVETKRVAKNLEQPLPYSLPDIFEKYQVLVAANRLSIIKNTEALIPIYKALPNQEKVKLLIIGEGEEKERIQQFILSEGLSYSQVEADVFEEKANIYFLNFQENIHSLISKSNVFLFSTKAEGLPLTLLEAMSAGAPILVSDCPNGGIGEIIKGTFAFDYENPRLIPEKFQGGYLMPIPLVDRPETIEKWKNKIEEILTADQMQLKKMTASNKAKAEEFDIENVKVAWVSMIQGLFEN
ncbi:hypothetical protein TH63_02835 [Rufibacter radiotolerans]|uniref:Glycosyl transferase family 1 domain-containing protein n=2 Tax=Rufibacter radiotolerans TaxID=1379910 RepID=A0A0H4VLL9_9BACT|nr:hypothetical protein TH63_02835 [Rufibacter radiotolerans]